MLIIFCLLFLLPGGIIVYAIYSFVSKLFINIDQSNHKSDFNLYFLLYWLLHAYGFYKAFYAAAEPYKPTIYTFINSLVDKLNIDVNMIGGNIELFISITFFSALLAFSALLVIKFCRLIIKQLQTSNQ